LIDYDKSFFEVKDSILRKKEVLIKSIQFKSESEKRLYCKNQIPVGFYLLPKHIVFLPYFEQLPDIFILDYNISKIIISEKLKNLIELNKITGLDIEPIGFEIDIFSLLKV
jgi:hypothetical protein